MLVKKDVMGCLPKINIIASSSLYNVILYTGYKIILTNKNKL